MTVRTLSTSDKADLHRFVELERDLLAAQPLWVPPLEADSLRRLSGRSELHRGVDCALFVASGTPDAARCAAFVNHRYQAHHQEGVGFIGYFAAAPRSESAVVELLGAAEEWLRAHGVTRVIAPYDASGLAAFALRTADFDSAAMYPMQWHPPYYAEYLCAAGYQPTYPWWFYDIDFASAEYRRAYDLATREARCTVRPIRLRRWDQELQLLLSLFNETFTTEWEFYPFTIGEFREVFGQFRWVADARQAAFAEVDGQTVAFNIGVPDYNPVLQKLQGRFGPLQQLRFLVEARRTRNASVLFGGVRAPFRGRHITHTMFASICRRYEELGSSGTVAGMINEKNGASRAVFESFGGRGKALYHNFDKRL